MHEHTKRCFTIEKRSLPVEKWLYSVQQLFTIPPPSSPPLRISVFVRVTKSWLSSCSSRIHLISICGNVKYFVIPNSPFFCYCCSNMLKYEVRHLIDATGGKSLWNEIEHEHTLTTNPHSFASSVCQFGEILNGMDLYCFSLPFWKITIVKRQRCLHFVYYEHLYLARCQRVMLI